MRKSIALGIAAAFVSGGVAIAAQQGAAAKKLLLKSGNTTKIVYLSKNTTGSVGGNPMTNGGASFNVDIGGDGTQCMLMPQSGWSAISTIGFKYKDPQNANGPVKVALIKETPSGNFLLKVITKGNTVVPGDPTTSYNTNFKINGGGDEYCASDGSATPTKDTAEKFLVKSDDGVACTTACSSPSGAFLEVAAAF